MIFLVSFVGTAQISDLARVDFTIIPRGNSEIEYNRLRGLFNYPVKLKKEGRYLIFGFDYSHINLKMDDNLAFEKDELEGFQLLDFNFGYTTPLKNNWRFAGRFMPGFSSNLTANDLNFEDLVLSGDLVFIKDETKNENPSKRYRLMVGVSYSGNRGINFPLPFISYYRKFSPNWSYNFGVPKSNFQYHISEKHRLKLYAELDGFTSNLQKGVTITNGTDEPRRADKINMNIIVGGLEYEFHFTEYLIFYARATSILSNNIELRSSGNKKIISLDESNNLYLRTGIRFKI